MKRIIVLIIAIFMINIANAQTTIILRPDSTTGKYAIIPSLYPNDNYYNLFVDFAAAATTNGGNFTAGRSLIDFDLSSIPAMAVITGATLNLYSYNSPSNSTNLGDNVSYLQRITSSWNPMTVTWNTAPSTTTLNQETLQASTSANEIYNVNVTNLIQDYVNDKANSFGFMLRLATEATYRRLVFGSSQNPDSTLRPELVITYNQPISTDTCITLRPDSTTGKYAIMPSLYPNDNYYNLFVDFAAAATTSGGNFTAGRSLIDFDLSSIPAMAVITGATLNLYSYNSPSNSTNLGDNVSYLQRITSSWNPMTVTWNTAPTTTTLHQVTLDASTSADEIYNVNVTNLVQDYVNNKANSFGFMLRLATEATYRRLVFGSSQNPDSTLRPKLHVCYSTVNGINKHNTKTNLSIYPNPTKDILTIETNINTEQKLDVLNLIGQTVYTSYIYNKKASINTSAFAKGVYILKLSSDKETVVRKFIKQ